MLFANDTHGERIHIDDAEVELSYFCPACGGAMIQKRGDIITHHFAHKAGSECDQWYTERLSPWHRKMQNTFTKDVQEIVIWNNSHTEFHIADVALQARQKKYVIEFQHSTISKKEFITRSKFYVECGYTMLWVFDFCECFPPKKILIAEEYENNGVDLVWPGKDRVRFLDSIDFSDFDNYPYVFFHVNTGKGKLQLHQPDGYCPWETWEYVDPFSKEPCFVWVPMDEFDTTSEFYAVRYSEQQFYRVLKNLSK